MKHRTKLSALLFLLFCASAAISQPLTPILTPGDAIIGGQVIGSNFEEGVAGCCSSGVNQWPGNEGPENTINNQGQKYLNFGELNTGVVVTPAVGSSIACGLKLWTANDAVSRDPTSYTIYGTNASVSSTMPLTDFTPIASGALSLPDSRNLGGNAPLDDANSFEVSFPGVGSFTSYLVIFPTIKDASDTNSMQIAEAQILTGCTITTVPTMGEWGLISLAILLMIFGVVAVGQRRSVIA